MGLGVVQGVDGERLRKQAVEIDAAVSYTHLRAHETVLDLVCRLLLEKKNTKQRQVDSHSTTSPIYQHKLTNNYDRC